MKAFSWYCKGYSEADCTNRMYQRGFRYNQPQEELDTPGQPATDYRFGIFIMCRWDDTTASPPLCVTSDGTSTRTNWDLGGSAKAQPDAADQPRSGRTQYQHD
eukprot:4937444-Prymnesium_polylepis.1